MDLNRLPNEVLERIFANIPGLDLMRTMTLVCTRWREIINRRRFQPWKKSYFRYKVGENGRDLIFDDSEEPPQKKLKKSTLRQDLDWKIDEFKDLMRKQTTAFWNEKINGDQYLHPAKTEGGNNEDVNNFRLEIAAPWLVKFIADEFAFLQKEGNFKQISNHSKYSMSKDFLQERMPEFADNDLANIVILTIIADNVWDIEEVIRVLTKPSLRSCSSLEASEVAYAIALAFLVFHRRFGLPSKWHYNMFHAISIIENEYNGGIEAKKTDIKKGQTSLTQTFGFTKTSSKVCYFGIYCVFKDTQITNYKYLRV